MKLKAYHNVFENKLRTYLILIGIAVCFMIIITVDGMLNYMILERENETKRFDNKILIQPYSSEYPAVRNVLREEEVISILNEPHINQKESSHLLWISIKPGEDPMEVAKIMGLGIKPGCEATWIDSAQAASGKNTLVGEPENSIILGDKAAKFFDVKTAGEEIVFAGESWHVAGILHPAALDYLINTDNLVVMQLAKAQSVFKMQGMISSILLVSDGEPVSSVLKTLSEKYPYLQVSAAKEIEKLMKKELELPRKFLGVVSGVSFFAAVMIIMTLLMLCIQEKIQNPETVMVIGTNKSAVIKHTFSQSILMVILGGSLGVGTAMPVACLLGWSWILNGAELIRVLIMIFLAGLLAAVYPCFQAIKAYPKVLHYKQLEKAVEDIGTQKHIIGKAFHQLISAREEEREHLARELHDEAIQSLVGLKFIVADSKQVSQSLLQKEINDVINTLRSICTDLRPPALQRLGLRAVLSSYMSQISEKSGIEILVNADGFDEKLPPEIELALFRIIQEAVSNAWKHAEASRIKIDLILNMQQVMLMICDDGKGFTVPENFGALIDGGHFGLVNMQERAAAAGGEMKIESAEGRGTCIKVNVPVVES